MHDTDSKTLFVTRAMPQDNVEALGMAVGPLEPEDRLRRIASMAEAGANWETDLWVGYRGAAMVAAMLAQVQPGRTATIVPPRIAREEPRRTATELLSAVTLRLARGGVRIAQALLETDHGPDVDALKADGFGHISDLLYLVSLAKSFPESAPHDGLEFVPYSAEQHKRLCRIVEQTYEGSLDCPQLNHVRSVEDVLAGYRALGAFDPLRWRIVRHAEADVGCLLLADHPPSKSWELVYMGLVPEARGHGFGLAMARYAQWMTAGASRERLTTAVDAANTPAIAAYAAAGFVGWDRRSVYLRVF